MSKKPKKWSYDEKTKTVTIHKNGEYNMGISEDNYIVIRVAVRGKNVGKELPKDEQSTAESALHDGGVQVSVQQLSGDSN